MRACGNAGRVKWTAREISRECEQFLCLDLSDPSPAAKTLDNCGHRALSPAQATKTPYQSQECAGGVLFSLCNRAHCLKEGFLIFLCPLYFLPQRQAHFSQHRFLEDHRVFSLFDVSEVTVTFWVPRMFRGDNCAC